MHCTRLARHGAGSMARPRVFQENREDSGLSVHKNLTDRESRPSAFDSKFAPPMINYCRGSSAWTEGCFPPVMFASGSDLLTGKMQFAMPSLIWIVGRPSLRFSADPFSFMSLVS